MSSYIRSTLTAMLCLVLALAIQPAQAEGEPVSIIPAKSLDEETSMRLDNAQETHPPLKLTPDKSELIRLSEEAGSIIIGNPAHLNILADSSNTLIAVPRQPGASHFAVLNKKGDIIMSRHVIVGSPKQKYVRVRRTCYGDYGVDDGCQPTRTYYCPDMCHEVSINHQPKSSGPANTSSQRPSSGGSDDNDAENEDEQDDKDEQE